MATVLFRANVAAKMGEEDPARNQNGRFGTLSVQFMFIFLESVRPSLLPEGIIMGGIIRGGSAGVLLVHRQWVLRVRSRLHLLPQSTKISARDKEIQQASAWEAALRVLFDLYKNKTSCFFDTSLSFLSFFPLCKRLDFSGISML